MRGGIPLVFPVFGTSKDHLTSSLPQHGFARRTSWRFLGQASDSADKVAARFSLDYDQISDEMKSKWPVKSFGLVYTVILSHTTLTSNIEIHNEKDGSDFEYNVLLHTYLRINDIDQISVEGLEGVTYVDKVNSGEEGESSGPLKIKSETDRVYKSPQSQVITIKESGKIIYEVERHNMKDIVTWNPWSDKLPADFEPKSGYRNMICIEPGCVASFETLKQGDSKFFGQSIKAFL